MENKEPFIYEDAPLTFKVNGEEINGTLSGSFKLWQFRSNSPAFVQAYPNGVISSGMLYLEIKEEHNNIYDGIVEAAEAEGYSFEDPEKEEL